MLMYYPGRQHKEENWRAVRAFMFGRPLVIDLSMNQVTKTDAEYDQCCFPQAMSDKNARKMANVSLSKCIRLNAASRDPFALHFTNLSSLNERKEVYEKRLGVQDLALLTNKHHFDLFEKQDLLYLSPDSPVVLDKLRGN